MPPWETVEPKDLTCTFCNNLFQAKRETAKYCSDKCRYKARWQRREYDSEYRRVYYERTKEQRRPQDRKNERTRARRIRKWISDYKAARGCVDCGFSDPRALDFDHIGDDKAFNVCNAKSVAQAQKEILKCVIRCANCHRIKTKERLEQVHKSHKKSPL